MYVDVRDKLASLRSSIRGCWLGFQQSSGQLNEVLRHLSGADMSSDIRISRAQHTYAVARILEYPRKKQWEKLISGPPAPLPFSLCSSQKLHELTSSTRLYGGELVCRPCPRFKTHR